jgi:hypothetical protein
MTANDTGGWIRSFSEISIQDVPLVGGKNASLGEMYRELASSGVRVPNGFAITAKAYWYFLRATGIASTIDSLLQKMNPEDVQSLRECGHDVRQTILAAELPVDLKQQILSAYAKLGGDASSHIDVAVRSSATAEDLPDASFAGQQETLKDLRHCCQHASVALRHSLQTEPFLIGIIRDSIISRLGFRSAYNEWSGRIWRLPVLCFRSTQRRDFETRY